MSGLIGKKIGMTSIYDENGKNLPCTVIEAGPCVVTQIKTDEVDGYDAIQLGFNDKNEKHTNNAEAGHFKKSREQFQLSSYKRLLDIYSSSSKTIDALMKLELPSGVEVEIKV